MAAFTWNDLQKAADEAGLVTWVVTADGAWDRQSDEAVENRHEETSLREHLTEKYTVVRRRGEYVDGKVAMNSPWVWVRRQGSVTQYVVLVRTSDTSKAVTEHAELVITDGLPAYLQLLRQLREAGLIS